MHCETIPTKREYFISGLPNSLFWIHLIFIENHSSQSRPAWASWTARCSRQRWTKWKIPQKMQKIWKLWWVLFRWFFFIYFFIILFSPNHQAKEMVVTQRPWLQVRFVQTKPSRNEIPIWKFPLPIYHSRTSSSFHFTKKYGLPKHDLFKAKPSSFNNRQVLGTV